MGRYVGPACRLCRREGIKLFLKGDRCRMAKCAVEQGRPSPGMHVARMSNKKSEYGTQLREKQRLRRFYGLQEGQFRLFFERALRRRGITGEQLLQMLEMRLDNLVYRLGLASSHRAVGSSSPPKRTVPVITTSRASTRNCWPRTRTVSLFYPAAWPVKFPN